MIPEWIKTVDVPATISAGMLVFVSEAMVPNIPRSAWMYYNADDDMSDQMQFDDGVEEELLEALQDETQNPTGNTLFIASDGAMVFKAVHASDEAVQSPTGQPVVFRGARDHTYIAVYPSAALRDVVRQLEANHPGDNESQGSAWAKWMEKEITLLAELASQLSPPTWDVPQ
jgi:hypothetical protein